MFSPSQLIPTTIPSLPAAPSPSGPARGTTFTRSARLAARAARVGDPPVGPPERLGELREAEERCAAAALGERDVFFLDYIDPNMEIDGEACPIDASLDEFTAAIQTYLERLRPAIVITHGSDGEYGHPQHRFTHQAVREAIRALAPWQPTELVTWMAHVPGSTTIASRTRATRPRSRSTLAPGSSKRSPPPTATAVSTRCSCATARSRLCATWFARRSIYGAGHQQSICSRRPTCGLLPRRRKSLLTGSQRLGRAASRFP